MTRRGTATDLRDLDEVGFEAPGPGFWELETTHHGLRPLSHFLRDTYLAAGDPGFSPMIEKYGVPIERIDAALVQGCLYIRPKAVGEGAKPSAPPPAPIMKLIARLHPEMRRRNRTAAAAWQQRLWRTEVDQWFNSNRTRFADRNLELQSVELQPLDDAALASHLTACLAHFEHGMSENLAKHGGDLMPVGDLLAHGAGWGIDAATMAALLRGASPATVETAELLAPVADALATDPGPITTIDDVRNLGPEVAAAVDQWVTHHAWRLVTSDDIDEPTLAELPDLQLRALLSAISTHAPEPDTERVRSQVPAEERTLFDSLLAEARYGMRQREDIRGICWNWSGGLVRRALLEAGRRLAARGAVRDADHVVELTPAEVDHALRSGRSPSPDEVALRAATRHRVETTPPPRSLGEPEAPPPLDAFPSPMARATRALIACMTADATALQETRFSGTGIGDRAYRGRACVVRTVADAAERLQPGDVLIAPFTGPSFNSLLPLVGALVVEEGGPLCHAAIVTREFDVPALVGTLHATTIESGSTVEVDPVAGTIRIVDEI